MVGCGIINGTSDNTLAPKANVSIEQAAILIYRLYGQSILKDITPLAEAFVSDQKAIITKLQGLILVPRVHSVIHVSILFRWQKCSKKMEPPIFCIH